MSTSLGFQGLPLLDHSFALSLAHPFTSRQAVLAGVSHNALTRLTAEGLIRRVLKGVYVAAQVTDSLVVRAESLGLVVPPWAVVTDRTAGWLHGANVLAPNDHLELPPISMFQMAGHTRLRNSLCKSGQRSLLPKDIMVIHGVNVTTPIRTAWDLGRLLHRDQAIGALDGLLRLGAFEKDELIWGMDRFRKQRGVVQLRALAPLADQRAESPGESTLRLRWLDESDLPEPTPQIPVLDAYGNELARLDLGIEEIRYAAEYDGERWHSSEEDKERDRTRRTWLRRERDWTIDVFKRENVYGKHQDAPERLRAGIAEARRNLGAYKPDI